VGVSKIRRSLYTSFGLQYNLMIENFCTLISSFININIMLNLLNPRMVCPICKIKLVEHSEFQDKICKMVTLKQFANNSPGFDVAFRPFFEDEWKTHSINYYNDSLEHLVLTLTSWTLRTNIVAKFKISPVTRTKGTYNYLLNYDCLTGSQIRTLALSVPPNPNYWYYNG
jgi:hypothetical protein